MFEKILQKILKQVIGQFTQQIDSNQLSIGIWSGQIQINKLKLHPNLFKRFGIPIKIIYSQIRGLKIKIPWKSFFSSPLVISMDSAAALCSIDNNEMSIDQSKQILISAIKTLIIKIGKQIVEKSKQTNDSTQDNYLQQMYLKIFDNLYLTIKNIHLRVQNPLQSYSFGLSIEIIQIYVVDQKGNKIFIDRKKNHQKYIRKKFGVQKFQIYWNHQQQQFFSNAKNFNQNICCQMKKSTQTSEGCLLYIDFRGLIKQDHSSQITHYDIEIIQQKIQIHVQKKSIQQFLSLIQLISSINQKRVKNTHKDITPQIDRFLKEFISQFLVDNKNNQKQKELKLQQIIKNHQKQIFQLIFFDDNLLKTKVQKIVLLNKDLLSKNLSLKQENLKKALSQFEKQGNLVQLKNQKSVTIDFTLNIPKIFIFLFDSNTFKPTLQLELLGSQLNYIIKNDQSNIKFHITSLQIFGTDHLQVFSIRKKQKKALELQIQKANKKTKIKCFVEMIKIQYNPQIIRQTKQFFTFNQVDSKLKNQAFQKIQTIQNNINSRIQKSQQQNIVDIQFMAIGLSVNFLHKKFQINCKTGKLSFEKSTKTMYSLINIQAAKCDLIKNSQVETQFNIIKPFDVSIKKKNIQQAIDLFMPEIDINLKKQIYLFMIQFAQIFSQSKKSQIMSQASLIGEIFIKQNRWRKSLAALYAGKLYIWNLQDQYPKHKLRIRRATTSNRGKITYITIFDKKDSIQIAFKTQKQLNQWRQQLEKITQLQNRLSNTQNNQQNSKSTQIKCQFKIIKLNLQLQTNKFAEIKLEGLSFLNYFDKSVQFEQKNKDNLIGYNILILTKCQVSYQNANILESLNNNNRFIVFKYFTCIQDNNVLEQKQILIDSFCLNFDPFFILKLQSFLKQSTQQVLKIKSNHLQQNLQKQDDQKILSKTLIMIRPSSANFKNIKSRLQIFNLKFQNLQIQITSRQYSSHLRGICWKLELSDLSGYPNTTYQSKQKSTPTNELFTSNQNQNNLSFQYISLQQGSKDFLYKKKDLLKIKFVQFRMNYIHQIMFRLIDYFFVQIVIAIINPQFFDQYSHQYIYDLSNIDYQKIVKKKEQINKLKSIHKMDKKKLQDQILNGRPMHFQIQIEDSLLNLVSQGVNEGVQISIKHCSITNEIKFVQKIGQNRIYKLYSPQYKITLQNIWISTLQKSQFNSLTSQPLKIKVLITMFNKDSQYKYLYQQKNLFSYHMNFDIQLEECNLCFGMDSLAVIDKFMGFNFAYDDGLDFIMIYDFNQFVTQFIMDVKIYMQAISIQLNHQNQSIVLQTASLNFKYHRQNTTNQLSLHSNMILLKYSKKQIYQQILTSRKNFGKFIPRRTFFRSLNTSNCQKNDIQNSTIALNIKTDNIKKQKFICFEIEQIMAIFNQNFILFLKKIQSKRIALRPIQKVYKRKDYVESIVRIQKSYKIITDKVIFCYKFPDSDSMILAIMFICQYNESGSKRQINFPHVQGFVSSQSQISNENIETIKKRTIFKPTQLKYCSQNEKMDLLVDRIFLKISVNDIKQLIKLQKDLVIKLDELSKTQTRYSNNSTKKRLKSLSNISQSINNIRSSNRIIQVEQVKIKNYSIGVFQLMIINDNNDNMIPLLYANIKLHFQLHALNSQFYVDFFNIRNSYWQPFIEKSTINIQFQPTLHVNSLNNQDFININISTNLIQNLYKTINQKQIKISSLYDVQQQIGKDSINEWVIINEIGEQLIIRSQDQSNQVIVQSNQSAKINFLSNFHQNFNQNNLKETQILINLVIGNKLQIKQLNINQLGLKKISFLYKQKKCTILKNFIIDISKNVRYLTFSSCFQFFNQTQLLIKFVNIKNQKTFIICPKQRKFIPFNIQLEDLILSDIKQIQEEQRLLYYSYNLVENNHQIDNQITLKIIQNSSSISFKGMIFKVQVKQQKLKKTINIRPFYLIRNLLSTPITIVSRLIDKQNMLTQIQLQAVDSINNKNQHYVYHNFNQSLVSYYIEGYQWTQFQLFSLQDKIIIKNFHNNAIQIKLQKINQKDKTAQVIFYYPLLIKNMTYQDFTIHLKSQGQKFILKKQKNHILCSKQVIVQINKQFSQKIILKANLQFFVFQKKINNLKTFAKYYVHKFFNKINSKLTIVELRIYNKYLIINQTKQTIILKTYPSKIGQYQQIQSGKTSNLVFFQIEQKKSLTLTYEFCPKSHIYQWSSVLNLSQLCQHTFFIRERHQFSKRKHFKLKIQKKLQNCYQILFKQIQQEQNIPYLIVNQCQNKEIYIVNTIEHIASGQFAYFNWEDPFNNCQKIFIEIRERGKCKKKITLNVDMKQSQIITSKSFQTNVSLDIIMQLNRRKFIFKDQLLDQDSSQQIDKKLVLQLPLRISLINNSLSPVIHVVDLSTQLKFEKQLQGNTNIITASLNQIQIDNQSRHNTLFSVVLKSALKIIYIQSKNSSLELQVSEITMKIEEDFIKSISSLKTFFANMLDVQKSVSTKQKNSNKSSSLFISRLILPKIVIWLQVQLTKFSLQTCITLQKPFTTSFPFKEFPYPLKKILLNVLSHLSISPWAFVTQFKKGVDILLTTKETSRAVQGFFGTILAAMSNSMSGVLGIIVGYDVIKVQHFIDGVDQGIKILANSIIEIPQFQYGACDLASIIQGTGKTLINIIVKPIKGILQMSLKISQGIKKTSKFSFSQVGWISTRQPIVFYNRQQYFMSYNIQESYWLQKFKQIINSKQLQYFYLIKFFKIQLVLDKIDLLLVIGAQYIVLLNLTKKKIVWIIQNCRIKNIQQIDICKIRFLQDQQYQNTNSKKLTNNYQQQCQVFLMNQMQANQVIQCYFKIRKNAKIVY